MLICHKKREKPHCNTKKTQISFDNTENSVTFAVANALGV